MNKKEAVKINGKKDSDKHRRKSAGSEQAEAAAEEEANYPCGETDRREVLRQGHLFWVR